MAQASIYVTLGLRNAKAAKALAAAAELANDAASEKPWDADWQEIKGLLRTARSGLSVCQHDHGDRHQPSPALPPGDTPGPENGTTTA